MPEQCFIEFAVRALGVMHVVGRADAIGGSLMLVDPPEVSEIEVDVDPRSCHTGRRMLDDAIRRGDLFATDAHSSMRFSASGIRPTGAAPAMVEGLLVLGGRSEPLSLSGRLVELDGGDVAAVATGTLSRRAWGLTWGSTVEQCGLVADRVRLTLAARFRP